MKKTILAVAGLLLASATAQAQWVLQPYSFANSYLTPFYLDAVDANVVWSAGLDVYDGEGGDEVAHTSNGGTTWVTNTISNLGADEVVTGVAGLSATTALVCTVQHQRRRAHPENGERRHYLDGTIHGQPICHGQQLSQRHCFF